jgi:tetratricopeptide (TPR) repeat protein
MTARGRGIARAVAVLVLTLGASLASAAQEPETPTHEAAKHFQRAVMLYAESAYRAALTEFRKAYALVPNVAVLYNIGETEYQLRDYAAAVTTFRRYLAESGPADTRRQQVESNVAALRARVGHVSITTIPPGADVAIDDKPIGKTPLEDAVLVSAGLRKIAASLAGRAPITRFVDVSSDASATITLQLPPADSDATAGVPDLALSSDVAPVPAQSGGMGPTLRTIGWIATGALAGGAVSFALLASKEAGNLKDARSTFPTTSATLSREATLTTTYAVAADSLAAAAVVLGSITLISTLTTSSSSAPAHGSAGATRVVLAPPSARLLMTF